MTEFEKVLQECLLDLESGDSNVDECLSRYPGHAPALEPILLTSLDLVRGQEARPSAEFKARVRTRLIQEMQAHPRKSIRFQFLFTRLATSFAVILAALFAAGTVYAQGALPGQLFYPWKLTSENAWRAISPDPVGTDLAIADRRANELIVIGNHAALHLQTLNAYEEVTARLKLEMNSENEARIRKVLNTQIEELNQSGVSTPPLEKNILPTLEFPTPIPTTTAIPSATPSTLLEIPLVNPTLSIPQLNPPLAVSTPTSAPVLEPSQSNPTEPSKIIPTLPVGPIETKIISPLPIKPVETKIIPTIQIPPLLP